MTRRPILFGRARLKLSSLAALSLMAPFLIMTLRSQALLPAAVSVVTTFSSVGGIISCDSFNSTNLALFPGGLYNPPNALDHGDVVTLSSTVNALNVGNA